MPSRNVTRRINRLIRAKKNSMIADGLDPNKPEDWVEHTRRLRLCEISVTYWRNTHPRATKAHWLRFVALNVAAHEVRRALWGIDRPHSPECYARLRRYILAARRYDMPRLP